MHWVLLLLAIAAMGVAFFIPQMWLLLVTLFGALGLLLFWTCVQYSKEYRHRNHDIRSMVDEVELQRLQELAAARRLSPVVGGNDDVGGINK